MFSGLCFLTAPPPHTSIIHTPYLFCLICFLIGFLDNKLN
ncbi:hypothetical protein PAUR_b0425 [Pseudoalteromonas aurantia 208]|uniref:Uncharacterized protein n=1 Tax=Pseudoalteromonas aurantia 208 TaxID=1314867 RepID=A0ABR9EHD1_9GAMM|nr:hypothetical protein [Pseudoalteromonas aurantia 208]